MSQFAFSFLFPRSLYFLNYISSLSSSYLFCWFNFKWSSFTFVYWLCKCNLVRMKGCCKYLPFVSVYRLHCYLIPDSLWSFTRDLYDTIWNCKRSQLLVWFLLVTLGQSTFFFYLESIHWHNQMSYFSLSYSQIQYQMVRPCISLFLLFKFPPRGLWLDLLKDTHEKLPTSIYLSN